ncbi:nuclear transport factor 2 family protein [Streptomyces sp. NPDC005953]|uniref:nuclear transport factor 2 family protein n=1 Tax=Streptomyces sp. NPDC005953 TaxID=3156719 RepID=UPI0033C7AC5A
MTQRVDLATVMDRLAIDELVTRYAVAVDDADWSAFRELFAPGGRADYRSAGGIEGSAAEVADWMAGNLESLPVRQHLVVNRLLRLQDLGGYFGDDGEVQADYLHPVRGDGGEGHVSGGRYTFGVLRTDDGWRLTRVVMREKWRNGPGAPTGV